MESYIRRATFREPKPTDRKLDFATYHDIVMAVARSLGIGLNTEPAIPVLRFMELDDDLPPYDESAAADASGNMPYIDKSATVLYYDLEDQFWKRDDTQQKVVVCNPYLGCRYYQGERMMFLYLAQAGKFIPLVPLWDRWYGRTRQDIDATLVNASVDRYELVAGSWVLQQVDGSPREDSVLVPPTFGGSLAMASVVHVTWDRQAQSYRIDEREC